MFQYRCCEGALTREDTTVVTMIEPGIRPTLDLATRSYFRTIHTDSLSDAIRAVNGGSVHAFLVSPAMLANEQLGDLGRFAAGNPGLLTVVLLEDHRPRALEALMHLGTHGVQHAVDLSYPSGWAELRSVVMESGGDTGRLILTALIPAIGESTDGTRRFFNTLTRLAPRVTTHCDLARFLGVHPNSMISRFNRAGLPSPKRYLSETRLLYAAALFESSPSSIAKVSAALRYSSPQHFGRHVLLMLDLTAADFREVYSLKLLLERYLTTLIRPFEERFRTFDPLR